MILWSFLGVINACGSIMTLMLIYKLKKVNGYMKMVLAMTVSQAVYDIALLMFDTNILFWQYTQLFLGIFCGTMTGMWSLVIVFVMVYIIASRSYFDVDSKFKWMLATITISCLAFTIACTATYIDKNPAFLGLFEAFNVIRVLIIVVTTICVLVAVYQLRDMFDQKSPVRILVKRLTWYPLVQLMSRLPITVYQLYYATPLREFAFVVQPSGPQKFWFMSSVIFTGSGGLGNLVAFLNVQPDASVLVWSYLPCCKKEKATHGMPNKLAVGRNSMQDVDITASVHEGNSPMFPPPSDSRPSSLYSVNDAEAGMGLPDVPGAAKASVSGLGREGDDRDGNSDYEVDYDDLDEEELVKQIANHPLRMSMFPNKRDKLRDSAL